MGLRYSLPILVWHLGPRSQVVSLGLLMPWVSMRTLASSGDVSLAQMHMSPLIAPSACFPSPAGLPGLIECQSECQSIPMMTHEHYCCCTSGCAHIHCRMSKAGLQGHVCQDVRVDARFVPVVPWVMSGFASFTAQVHILVASDWALHSPSIMPMLSCKV